MSDNERDFDDDVEDEEDFEDDDFEDEVEEEIPKKKKRKKEVSAASYFLDTEADVDEEAEEEEEEYEKESGEIDWDAAQAEANAAQQNRQFHRRQLYDQDKSVEELAREIEERHKNYVLEDEDLEDDEDAPTELKRTGMLPSVRDPKLWMVHCKIGKERPTVIALMRKFFDAESKLAIKSAIAPSHLKGFIYIEAEKESHVKHAIKGMRTLSEWTLKLVPIKEMADVLTVTKKANAFRKGDWVRVKRGLYKHDIGQVYDVDESRGRVTVKLIPRLDLQNMNKPEDGKKVKRTRMPARFFNPDEVNQVLGGRSDMDRRVDPYTGEHFYVLMGNRFLNGYLLKPMDVRSLEGGEVQPTLEELKKFQEKPPEGNDENTTTSSEDLASLASTLKQQRRVAFKKGDSIIVVEGDLKHLMGTVESVDRETVTIRPKHEELHDLLTFPADQLRKYFKKGDHVKVITGRFEGETGLIIRVEENSVIIFSDLTNQEIKVFTQDIQECSEVSTGKIKLGNYELHDLVAYGATVGIITKIERDQFKLLDTTGTMQTVALTAMGPKKNSPKNANTIDSNQNTINVGDIVKVTDGQHKGRQGTIKHIFRYFLFLHSREMLENSGIFVCRTSHVTALGAKSRPGDFPGNFPGNTSHFPPSSPGPRNLRSPSRNAPSGPVSSFDSRKRSFKDTLKDKHVVILRGQWKGYVGVVRDSTETNCRIELHTNSKVVTVPRDSVRLKDETAAEGSMQEPSLYPPQTPAWGSRTPMREDPSATPMRTPGTPLRTPSTPLRGVPGTPVHGTAWDASIPNTPMRTGSSWEPDYSANWTPSTPGTYGTQFTPYSPARSQYDNTPAENPTTPSALTPGTYDQRTPMDSTPYSSAYQPNTPGTPGPVTPRGPNTPASEYGEQATPSSPGRYQWYIPKAEVTVNGEVGVIQDVVIEKGMFVCKVTMDSSKQTVSVPADQAVKVVPGKGHAVIIVMGEQKGQTGTLIGIDNEDGIVKMDSNLDIKILDREHLAKYRKRS